MSLLNSEKSDASVQPGQCKFTNINHISLNFQKLALVIFASADFFHFLNNSFLFEF